MDEMTPEQRALAVRRWRRARTAFAVVLAIVTWPVALVVTLALGSAMLDLSQPAILVVATIISMWPFAWFRLEDWLSGRG